MPKHSRNLPKNPDSVTPITLNTHSVSATAVDDTITLASQSLKVGAEIILTLTGGSAQGLVSGQTYYVVPVDATHIKVALTRQDAFTGSVVDITGDAGAGRVYPFYRARGYLYVGTGGALRLRGTDRGEALHKNIANGTLWPLDIAGVHSFVDGETPASDLTIWY